MREEFLDFLKMNEVEYKENVKLKDYSSIKIGGLAPLVVFPDSESKMIITLEYVIDNHIKYKVVGRLTNLLISDDTIEDVIIKTDKLRGAFILDRIIRLYAGERLSGTVYSLAKRGIGGFSQLSGIPGSIGGAIRNNAGAYGLEISDMIESVTVYSPATKSKVSIKKEDLSFGYRSSIFSREPYVVLYADFHIKRDDAETILDSICFYKEQRRKHQPTECPSLGSVFKRPFGNYAAAMIDDLGLKGYSVGGAKVSEKHAGFIINAANASFQDVCLLTEHIKQAVYEKYNLWLDEEIEIYKGK